MMFFLKELISGFVIANLALLSNNVIVLLCVSVFSAMVPEYWLTEGGQSATGALLDHVIENHVASPHLANRAASRSEIVYSI
jgi:ribulose kinase